ncbi:phage tail assembly chaperone [Hyphomonas jannaschiana]|nr:phage tail assembly chaperone [Hyphomonas jannaschiana]
MLPWAVMLRAALSAGVTPDAFWRLSLREWRWLAGEGGEAMSRGRLAALMGAYPDGEVRAASSFDFAQDESRTF